MGRKIISFSLYGTGEKYRIGMLCNIELQPIIYPGWEVHIYYNNHIPKDMVDEMSKYENVTLFDMSNSGYPGMCWRFLAADEDNLEIAIFRDADSRLSFREKKLVDVFMKSDYLIHDIRDNLSHNMCNGGMWGVKGGVLPSVRKIMDENNPSHDYFGDTSFLSDVLFNYIDREKIMIHDGLHRWTKNKFPIKNDEKLSDLIEPSHPDHKHFVGEVFETNRNKPRNHVFY